jgi:hypothetical protein
MHDYVKEFGNNDPLRVNTAYHKLTRDVDPFTG